MGQLGGVATTFIVIIAAGFGVLIGFAMFHRVVNNRSENSAPEDLRTGGQQTQASYMQEVRTRNRMDLFAKYGGGRYQMRPVVHDVESGHGSESQY